jgi:protein gp37
MTVHPDQLAVPLHWRKPRLIFVDSMSDLFHPEVPDEFIFAVFEVIASTPRHTYQILTKRSARLAKVAGELVWPANLWMGVSVESAAYAFRIRHLLETGAKVKFLSIEPLLGSIGQLQLVGIDWVIVGGESGAGARVVQPNWVRDVRDQCVAGATPFFFKQWGGRTPKAGGRELDGVSWSQMPERVEAGAGGNDEAAARMG